MKLSNRIARLEEAAAPRDMQDVLARMALRGEIRARELLGKPGMDGVELSHQARALAARDTEDLRRADQAAWEKHAHAQDVSNFAAEDGALFERLAVRIRRAFRGSG